MMRAVLTCFVLFLASAHAAAAAGPAPGNINVLFVGNSLSYVNNLPALFAALAPIEPGEEPIRADLIAAPGGTIAERWHDGFTAREIAGNHWQVLVLQERGGLLACLSKPAQRNEPECMASVSAHKKFAKLARDHGMRVIVLGTWGPDAIWQSQLSRGLRKLADNIGADALDTGPLVRAYADAHPRTAMYSDALLHPTLDTSLLMAAELCRQIFGRIPLARTLDVSAPILSGHVPIVANRLLSEQPQLTGDGKITRLEATRLQPLIAAVIADAERQRND